MAFNEIPSSTSPAKTLFSFGLNHKTAPVEVREHLFVNDEEVPQLLALYLRELDECLVLSTCNRTEVYCVSSSSDIDVDALKRVLIDFKGAAEMVGPQDFVDLTPCTTTQQIFNVATSIDSQVIGDSQILRQLRHAYMIAQEGGATGKILHQLVQRACKLGKLTYRDTSLHHGAASISLAAVELATGDLGSLRSRTALVIGAGEMARTTSEALAKRHIGRVIVANRTLWRAEFLVDMLAAEIPVNGLAVDLADLHSYIGEADIIVGTTASAEPIIAMADLAGIARKQLLIDIAVPRDIDPDVAELDNVMLRNIDDLRSIVDGHQERRERDIPRVRQMIVDEMVSFLTWYYAQPLLPGVLRKGQKPTQAESAEIVRVKEFLRDNLAHIHALAMDSNGDFATELDNHFGLIDKLQRLKAETFGQAVA